MIRNYDIFMSIIPKLQQLFRHMLAIFHAFGLEALVQLL